jgi:hypothetical protein
MRELGIENFYIELYENLNCECLEQLTKREGGLIREIGTLNKKIEGRTPEEYYIDNKDKIKEYYKEYFNKPEIKEKIKEKQKEYNKEYYNKPEIKEKQKEYNKEYYNKQEIKDKQTQYYKEYNKLKKLNKTEQQPENTE